MNNDLKSKLQRDAKHIQQQAAARLQTFDLSAHIQPQLKATPKTRWFEFAALAAALCLMVMTAVVVEQIEPDQFSQPKPVVYLPTLKLDSLPSNLEQQFNQPLLQEQQAIIDDLKKLKTQLLSI